MASPGLVKPTHKAIKQYYAALKGYQEDQVSHEGALETAFQRLLQDTTKQHGWKLIPKQRLTVGKNTIFPDGTLRDLFNIRCGFWEAKDTDDDLEAEITKKIAKGYPLSNTIFEDTRQGVLYQGGQERYRFDLTDRNQLASLLNEFFAYTEPEIDNFHQAVDEFKTQVPELAKRLLEVLAAAHKNNKKFQAAFDVFFTLCQHTLNPNISLAAVDEMLVQHLLTERLIRKIFDNPEFTRRNVIAVELEKVIDALVSLSFNRDSFLRTLDRFYRAIEEAAHRLEDFSEKQHFLNTIYERFFQGYSVKLADTHGIVYTPQEIVDFMCASVGEVLETEFGLSLNAPGVYIIDPCTGTGNFIVNLMNRLAKKSRRDLPRMYREQLFANEVMLMPYYIAALNIEHAYYELTGGYEAFEGLCFVDTLDLAEGGHALSFMTAVNTARVERQKKMAITVVIGNPPYNAWQISENDNNKNRDYKVIEKRIRETYAKNSVATNKNSLSDAYVKFFRWATDRIPKDGNGIVCMVSNNGFLTGVAFDGFRMHLAKDFDRIYHFDFKGNARTSGERRRREGGNIFSDQIRVGIGITILVRHQQRVQPNIFYHVVKDYSRAEQKKQYLATLPSLSAVPWQELHPDERHTWLVPENADEFAGFLPVGSKDSKSSKSQNGETVFKLFSIGVKTNRDEVAYDWEREVLAKRVGEFVDNYNGELDRYKRAGGKTPPDDFVRYDKIKWSRDLKLDLQRGNYASFGEAKIRVALYRPFSKRYLFFDKIINEEVYLFHRIFPTPSAEHENQAIALTTLGSEKPFMALMTNNISDLHLVGAGSGSQCFPFYVYNEDGSSRRENITDLTLKLFREHYSDNKISKWDIFFYVYSLMHHSGYRERFADNLKRELPRISFAPDFRTFVVAGEKLARLHMDYEKQEPYPLKWLETPGVPLSYRVKDKMRLSKDKMTLVVNPSLTLGGIPPETFQYLLGNRSALEWVIDQYQVSEDKRSGIKSGPNRADDEEYIVRLVGQVVRVSLETVRIVNGLPAKYRA